MMGPTYIVVGPEDLAKVLVLAVVDRFDDEPVVTGIVEEATALAGRPQLGQDILARQRDLYRDGP